MAIEFVQMSPHTATTGALVAADLLDFGTATHVSVQIIKFGYGTDGVYNEIATGQGLPIATGLTLNVQQMTTSTSPVSVGTWTATGQVLIAPLASATGPVSVGTWTATGIVRIDTHSTATLPVSIATLPTTATLAVVLPNTSTVNVINQFPTATGALTDVMAIPTTPMAGAVALGVATTATGSAVYMLRAATTGIQIVNVNNTATVTLTGLPSSATIPVLVQNTATVELATGTRVYLVQQMTTSTSPVSVGTWTATGQVLTSALSSATLPVSLANTATVNIANTATVLANIGGKWAHDATSTGNPVYIGGIARTSRPTAVAAGDVVESWHDSHGRQVITPICVRDDVIESQFTLSSTGLVTFATAPGTGVFNDLIWMTLMNNATTEAMIRVRSTSTATKWAQINLAPDGGGIAFQPARPAKQSAANGVWDVQLASEIVGQVDVSAEFMRTT